MDWQPIETAPFARNILLFAKSEHTGGMRNFRMETGHFKTGEGWYWGGRLVANWEIRPTHWMPLPHPPQEER